VFLQPITDLKEMNNVGVATLNFGLKMSPEALLKYAEKAKDRKIIVGRRIKSALRLKIYPGGDLENEPEEVDWRILPANSTKSVAIKVNHKYPEKVSQFKEKDVLVIEMADYYHLISDEGMPVNFYSTGAYED
jgi:K+-sensing histidine kinase KdpD